MLPFTGFIYGTVLRGFFLLFKLICSSEVWCPESIFTCFLENVAIFTLEERFFVLITSRYHHFMTLTFKGHWLGSSPWKHEIQFHAGHWMKGPWSESRWQAPVSDQHTALDEKMAFELCVLLWHLVIILKHQPSLSKDIRYHVWPFSFLYLWIIRADIKLYVTRIVNLVSVMTFCSMFDHSLFFLANHQSIQKRTTWWLHMATFIFLRDLCGHV